MIVLPHYLLYAEAGRQPHRGDWRFVLESLDGQSTLEAADVEPQSSVERLELLTVVRGLEALDQPARVMVLTPSRYVNQGLTHGLDDWRENDWHWESFGRMTPIKNRDLWQRVDHARQIHAVHCTRWRFDEAHAELTAERSIEQPAEVSAAMAVNPPPLAIPGQVKQHRSDIGRSLRRSLLETRRRTLDRIDAVCGGLAQMGAGVVAPPWL